ncbi:MAG: 1,4-alpha-glucan branching enzyme, partial [Alphaproteobacteria bacterium]|nr:1,4-alpha-glucan branching enzyme [Alphaproteobacteria bacterium]
MLKAKAQLHRISAIVAGDDHDPFSFLGMHKDADTGELLVRVFRPDATRIDVLDRETGEDVAQLVRAHDGGLYAGPIAGRRDRFRYRLRVTTGAVAALVDDPYAFGPILGELDLYL